MPAFKTPKQATGSFGENLAADYLKKQGFKLLARNWRKGSYELDIICSAKDTLIFVEVKTRGKGSLERPEEALTPAKQKSLVRAAREYLKETEAWDLPCRFDLVSVNLDLDYKADKPGKGVGLEHIENVIEFDGTVGSSSRRGRAGAAGTGDPSLGGGNSPWQPW